MTHGPSFNFQPENFSGPARLFPLPGTVLFPHVVQPLHIFEPRYRALLHAALASDQLIAMALLEPGWENHYDGRPPIAPMACLGRVLTHTRLDDGTYNILLVGLHRARLLGELPPTRPFREAEVELVGDDYPPQGVKERAHLQRRLWEAFRQFVPESALARDQFEQLAAQPLTLGMLTDIMSYTLNFEISFKREMLLEPCVDERAGRILECLAAHPLLGPSEANDSAPAGRPFPPDFSAN